MAHVLGIDEAGRGPVIGSMFIAGVMVHEDQLPALESLGLKDSKKLSDAQRIGFAPKIEEVAEKTVVHEVTAQQIDELRKVMSLNEIELRGFAKIVDACFPDKVFMDLPEPNGERFSLKVKSLIDDELANISMVAEHKADDTYPIVSAASILAKNAREEHVKDLHGKYGVDFRTGYPHDQDTIQFLKDYYTQHRELPAETRLSWSTAQRVVNEAKQSRLGNF